MNEVQNIKQGALDIVEGYTQMLEAIKNGEVNDTDIVEALIKNELIVKAAEEFKKAVKTYVSRALENVTDKNIYETDAAVIKVTSSPTKWDYSASDDWKALKDEEAMIAADRKALEKKMQITGIATKVGGGEKTVTVTLKS